MYLTNIFCIIGLSENGNLIMINAMTREWQTTSIKRVNDVDKVI